MNKPEIEAILLEFDADQGKYADFSARLEVLLKQILAERGFNVHAVTSRCKKRKNLERKLEDPTGSSYASLKDVTDVAGLRITTFLATDVDRIGKIIESEFEIDVEHSIDKRAVLEADRFGYLSLHYVVSLSAARAGLSEYRRFPGMKAEVQVRSILQHAWAEIEHDLGYKSATGIPKAVRRRFSLIAGLLELADQEFVSVRESLKEYEAVLPERIADDPAAVELDRNSVGAFVEVDATVADLDAYIALRLGDPALANFRPDAAASEEFRLLGISNIGQLADALRRHANRIKKFVDFWTDGKDTSGVAVYRGISLFYLRYVLASEIRDMSIAREVLRNVRFAPMTQDEGIESVFATWDKARNAAP